MSTEKTEKALAPETVLSDAADLLGEEVKKELAKHEASYHHSHSCHAGCCHGCHCHCWGYGHHMPGHPYWYHVTTTNYAAGSPTVYAVNC